VIVFIAFYAVQWEVNLLIKLLVVVIGSFAVSFGTYELLVRRVNPVRRLFGMKPRLILALSLCAVILSACSPTTPPTAGPTLSPSPTAVPKVVALPDGDPSGRFTFPAPTEGTCTSFCLDNGGQAVFGSNYDNTNQEGLLFVNKRGVTKTDWEAGTTGKYARWTAEYGSVTFNVSGAQMAWAGTNEAGLAISTMAGPASNPAPDERPPLESPLWIQYQLDTCATLEEVMANDSRVRITRTVDHYLVCDRSGACAAVEFLEGKTVFHTGEAMPVAALANSLYPSSVDAWQAGRLAGDSLQRFGIAADRVTGFQPVDAPTAVAYAFETLDRASAQAVGYGGQTKWSIVFDTETLRVYFRTHHNPQTRYVEFARLDFDCDAPAEMLDVNAPLAGDISDELDRFSFDANLESILSYIEKWIHPRPSAFAVEVMERGFESYACERTPLQYQEEQELPLPPVVRWLALALFHRRLRLHPFFGP
jgi:choloylglycine hydrolase